MELSDKQKAFSEFFLPFPESTSNFKLLKKNKMMVIGNVFPKLQTVKNFVRPFCKKRRFGTWPSSQDVKVCQALAKST